VTLTGERAVLATGCGGLKADALPANVFMAVGGRTRLMRVSRFIEFGGYTFAHAVAPRPTAAPRGRLQMEFTRAHLLKVCAQRPYPIFGVTVFPRRTRYAGTVEQRGPSAITRDLVQEYV